MQALTVTQRNRQPPRRTHPLAMSFGVENACIAYVNLEQTLPSAVHHIPSVGVLQNKVTSCNGNVVLTYRNRAHFLCPYCVEYTITHKTWRPRIKHILTSSAAHTHTHTQIAPCRSWIRIVVDCLRKVMRGSSRVYPLVARIAPRMNVTLYQC